MVDGWWWMSGGGGMADMKKKISKTLLMILLYDFLFGKGIQCGGPWKQAILRHKTRLHAELIKLKIQRKAKSNQDLLPQAVKDSMERGECCWWW